MRISVDRLFVFFSVLLLISVVYSKFLISISIISILILALYKSFKTGILSEFKSFLRFLPLSCLSLFFLLVLFSGINSENTDMWLHHMRLKLPYLVLPFSLYVFRTIISKYYILFHQIFIAVALVSTIPIFSHIIVNQEETIKLLGLGQSVDTPVDHIKYSLFVCFAVMSCFVLLFKKHNRSSFKVPKSAYILICIFLFLFLHLLSVRSGLVLAYGILALGILNELRIRNKYMLAIPALILIISTPIAAYKLIPSVKAKVGYMLWDLNEFKKGGGAQYSDSERLYSIQAGLKLFKEHPILGTGIGDLRDETSRILNAQLNYPIEKYPHNQFVFFLAGFGIFGFIIFLLAYFSAWSLFKHKEWLFIYLAILILVSFFVENTLERSYSIAFFIFFYSSGILFSQDKSLKISSLDL